MAGVATIGSQFAAVRKSRLILQQNQLELQESEERFRQLAENIDEVFWLMDWRSKTIIYVSPAYETIWGEPCKNLYDESGSWAHRIHPDDRDRVVESFEKKAELGGFDEQYRLVHPDGRLCWIRDRAYPVHDAEGCVCRMAGIAQDVTACRQAENALQENEERFRELAEFAPQAIIEMDAEGRFRWANAKAVEFSGSTAEELVDTPVTNQLIPEDRERLENHMRQILAGGQPGPVEYTACRKDGSTYPIETHSGPIIRDGRVTGLKAVIIDITERKRAEKTLCESRALLGAILESAADGILVVNDSGRVIHTNSHFARIWRIPERLLNTHDDEALLQFVLDQLVDPEAFHTKVRELYGSMQNDQDTLHFKDGRIFERYSRPLPQESGIAGRIWSFRDITERMHQQEVLARAKRLETAGQLAGQIAHDFNNLLGPLIAYPEMARRHLQHDSPVQRMLDIIETSAAQMAEINQQLLTLSRRGHYSVEPLDLNCTIDETLQAIGMPDTIAVARHLDPDLFACSGGKAQVQRVLVNILNNAREAMESAGSLTVATDNIYLDTPLTRYSHIRKGEYIRVRITDSGPGIPAEIMDRIFDPFFTTKTTDKHRGSGLGLSVVHSVVEDHDGYVDIESAPGDGTTVSLYFPICRAGVKRAAPPSETLRGAGQQILVVDDDPIQRQVAGDALGELGYTVSTAASGEEAVRMTREATYDILILDMVMDGIDGVETLRRVREIHPSQTALLMSGYAPNDRVQEAVAMGVSDFLAKPVRIPILADAIHRALRGRAPVDSVAVPESV